ncbi:LPXTG cell wall anchor domain-containing protein [Streptomyces sp. SCA2-2]|uniref:LPXTG cell wall anchor domain-containing protein n=1 Tax=Streptomyces sp. SCA2-2 TaxID=1563677 RepID=UPI001F5CA0FB|nr:LPXTG cell wall anchor domain-containing protein [Streptomyces sp. SCA2-2]
MTVELTDAEQRALAANSLTVQGGTPGAGTIRVVKHVDGAGQGDFRYDGDLSYADANDDAVRPVTLGEPFPVRTGQSAVVTVTNTFTGPSPSPSSPTPTPTPTPTPGPTETPTPTPTHTPDPTHSPTHPGELPDTGRTTGSLLPLAALAGTLALAGLVLLIVLRRRRTG